MSPERTKHFTEKTGCVYCWGQCSGTSKLFNSTFPSVNTFCVYVYAILEVEVKLLQIMYKIFE